jgi:hypothetical protein
MGCPGRAGSPARIPRIHPKIFCRIFVPRILHRGLTCADPPSQADPKPGLEWIEEFRCLKSCTRFGPVRTAWTAAMTHRGRSGPARASPRLQHLSASHLAVILMPQARPDRRVGEATSLPCGISLPQKLHFLTGRSRTCSWASRAPMQVYLCLGCCTLFP